MPGAVLVLDREEDPMGVARSPIVDLTVASCAVLLAFAPWIFGFESGIATWNACLSACAIVTAALAGLYQRHWEWRIGIGLWIVLSPVVLGFVQDEVATLIHMTVGLSIMALSFAIPASAPRVRQQAMRKPA